MSITKSLQKYLDNNKIKYEIIEHKTVYTAMDKARTLHLEPKQVAKTAVLNLDSKDHAIALIPADKLLDMKKALKVINVFRKKAGLKPVKKIDFAKEAWMKKNIDGQVGATPAFGKIYELPTFVDNVLLKAPKIIINGGDYEMSIKLAQAQFQKALADFSKSSFSMPKPKTKKKKK